jgi:Dimethlysulfonioproprionate lyase
MPDPVALLHTALGLPGSGRVRYGAAMELWRAGKISAEVLEVYRVTSPHDGRDPLSVLRELGLPLPPTPQEESPVRTLYTAARDYLSALDHPGAAEVRAGLPADPGSERGVARRGNAVVDRWLQPALQALTASHAALANAIAGAADQLEWVTYDAYPRDQIGEPFATGHAFASILGGDAPFAAKDFDLGLFLIAPDVLYRDHHHAAPELYAPLTGPHGWRFGTGRPLIIKPAHEPVWNPSYQPHLTKVGSVPFLGLFVWTKDVSETAVVLPASDWETLEMTSLETLGQGTLSDGVG